MEGNGQDQMKTVHVKMGGKGLKQVTFKGTGQTEL